MISTEIETYYITILVKFGFTYSAVTGYNSNANIPLPR